MCVMTAGVHGVDLASVGEALLGSRGVGQAGGFLNGVRVHIGAEPHHGSGSVGEPPTTPVVPMPSVTAKPSDFKSAATIAAACVSVKAICGC